MRLSIYLAILIFVLILAIRFHHPGKPTSDISLHLIQNNDLFYQLPENEEEWFDMKFNFVIENNSESPIKIVHPNAYMINPHPWIVKLDDKIANKWSGAACAGLFEESDKVIIKSGESKEFEFQWTSFTESFSCKPGKHILSIKYHLDLDSIFTIGGNVHDLSEICTKFSNAVEIEINK